jgi:hypothetical protein
MSLYYNTPVNKVSGKGGTARCANTAANSFKALNSGTSLPCREVILCPSVTNISAVYVSVGSTLISNGIPMAAIANISEVSPRLLRIPIDDVNKIWMTAKLTDQTLHCTYRN